MPIKPTVAAALLVLGSAATANAEIGVGRYWGQPEKESTLLRFELAAESAVTNVSSSWLWNSRGDAVLMNEGDAHSRGVEGRLLFGMSRVYIGLELGVSQITSAPALRDGHAAAPSGIAKTTPPSGSFAESTGSSLTMAAPIGFQASAGRLLVGVEGLVGWRRMSLAMTDNSASVDGFVPLVETRVRAGVWITPTLSLSLIAGKGVVVNDSQSICLSLSLSKLPFDGER